MRRIELIAGRVTVNEASRNERLSSFSVWKTLFCAVLTKCYNYCKLERVIIDCWYDVSNKSIEQICNPLITVVLPSKHMTVLIVEMLNHSN
jgi:hypothetical protein